MSETNGTGLTSTREHSPKSSLSRTRKALIAAGVLMALVGGAAAFGPALLLSDGVDYSSVASIQAAPEYQDAALLEKAWALPVAAAYRAGIDYQGNPSFCGPTTVVNVMRSLGVAAEQGTVLADSGLSTVFGMLLGGITLDQIAGLSSKRLGRPVTVLRDLDLAAFRQHLRQANDPSHRYAINFHRGPLFGKGGGHHSPIAGYLEAEDLVLVLDVNKAFRPWLVRSERLFAAIDTVDPSSGKKRGLIRIE